MIKEQELKEQCTLEFIKWLCEYSEGFEFIFATTDGIVAFGVINKNKWYSVDSEMFSLLIHRAVEGCNNFIDDFLIYIKCSCVDRYKNSEYVIYCFENYQSQTLTQSECAMLHCLLDKFSEQEESDDRSIYQKTSNN